MSCQQNFQQPVASRWPSVSKPKYKRPATLRGRNRAQKIVDHGYLDTLSLRVYQISYRVRLLWYANLSLFDSIFTLLVLTHLAGPSKSLTHTKLIMSHVPKNSFNLLMGICISAGQHLAALETFKFPSLWSAKLNSITSPKANLETADQQRQKNRELTSHWHTHRYPAFQQKTIGFCQGFTKKVNWGSQFLRSSQETLTIFKRTASRGPFGKHPVAGRVETSKV